MGKVKTVQVDNRLIIADGKNPLRYLDLDTNKVHVYKPPKRSLRERLFNRWPYGKPKTVDHSQAVELKTDGYIKPREPMIQFPQVDGYREIGTQPNVMNILTIPLKKRFDGQITWYVSESSNIKPDIKIY